MGSRLVSILTLVFAALLLTSQTAAATTYTITVSTDKASYQSGQEIKITGAVSPAPGPSTAVFVKVINPPTSGAPKGTVVSVGEAPVGATGAYNFSLVAGGTTNWITGKYTVNATWGAYQPTIFKTTSFNYTAPGTTTTTSTTTTSSTTSSTSSSTTSSSTTSTSSSSSSSSSSSTTPTSSTSTSSSSSSGGGGGIPEFPFQASIAALFAGVLVGAYLLARRASARVPMVPSTR